MKVFKYKALATNAKQLTTITYDYSCYIQHSRKRYSRYTESVGIEVLKAPRRWVT